MRCQAAPRSHWVFKQASGPPPQNVNQKILTLHGFCFIIIVFSQPLYHQGLTEGGKNEAALKEKGKKKEEKNKTITLRHLVQYFSPSFGRITGRPPPWLSVSVREIAFFPEPPSTDPQTLHPTHPPPPPPFSYLSGRQPGPYLSARCLVPS